MDDQEPLFPEIVPPDKEHFVPANRNGRRKGSRNLRHLTLEKIANENAFGLLRAVCAQAMAGDMVAAKIILDRIWPRPRTAPVAVDLPACGSPAEIRDAMTKLVEETFSGGITAEDGMSLMNMLKAKLESHSIRTVDGTAAPTAGSSDAREILFNKLRQSVERRVQSGPAPEDGATIQ